MRYIAIRNEKREYLIVDTKSVPHRVLCTCTGYEAPFNCEQIIEALETFHNGLYSKFSVKESTNG